MVFKFHHLHLICSDLEKMIAFFGEALGAKLVERKKFGDADGAVLNLNGTSIFLRTAREADRLLDDASVSTYGYNHVGLEVPDLQAVYRDLTNKGHVFSAPPAPSGGRSVAFLKGPDGITIELLQA